MNRSSTHLSCVILADRSSVYRALIDARDVSHWMVPDGMTGHVHVFDAREGGGFRISLVYDAPTSAGKSDSQTDTYHGHFVRLVPDELVVEVMEFETADASMAGEMTVTFTLRDVEGGTRLDAVHNNVPPGILPDDNETGWRMSLDRLKRLVEARRSSSAD